MSIDIWVQSPTSTDWEAKGREPIIEMFFSRWDRDLQIATRGQRDCGPLSGSGLRKYVTEA